jgi:hypothetical protein
MQSNGRASARPFFCRGREPEENDMNRLVALLALTVLVGCGGARGATNVAHFARGVGQGTAVETVDKSMRVLTLHQFELEREEAAPNIYIETRWRDRTPFADEQGLGINAAQVRAMVRARPRSTTSGMGEVYAVDLTVEQRVRLMGSNEWVAATVTPEARAFAERIAEDLKRELDVGVRRF